ncbi:hypothetical protein PF008_g30371 [Phytophthora fragariae]|uniref:RxLR effector protein n=1 Tax=Phytophthora fragariae TaxID=53985 RepID=A0A6G0Q6J3_9STRA|nr:hypothetical protein PF008_g30371 [Phytophthora fragariae]
MRQDFLVLLVLVVIALAGRVDAGFTFTSPHAAFGISSVSAERHGAPIKRFLRGEGTLTDSLAATKSTLNDEERDVAQVAKVAASAMKAKAKINIMLVRGFSPAKALLKLSVTSLKDKNFNNFARYYAKYLAKYPEKASSLPATAEDVVVLPKLTEWLGQRLRPSQIKEALKDIGSTNVNKYLQLYRKDSDDVLALPKLTEWAQQKRPPSQVNILLKDLEIADVSKYMAKYMEAGAATTAIEKWTSNKLLPKEVAQKLKSAEVSDVSKYMGQYMESGGASKYMGQYMESGGANVAFHNWLDSKLLPQHIALKLKNAEVPDISKYMGQYMDAGGAAIALEKRIGLPRPLLPQEVVFRLQSAQVPDINKYLKPYYSMWGKKQVELCRSLS